MSTGDVSNGTQPGTGAACRDREVGVGGRGGGDGTRAPGRRAGRARGADAALSLRARARGSQHGPHSDRERTSGGTLW